MVRREDNERSEVNILLKIISLDGACFFEEMVEIRLAEIGNHGGTSSLTFHQRCSVINHNAQR